MIRISSLNKIYKSKKRKKCHALNDIRLTLPDAGLVFVLGKSGSGKSTLLNLVGGLDSITSGSIEVDGNDVSRLTPAQYANYRNSHVGFIFQDYHLIDELTVFENIKLSLDLAGSKDDKTVLNALSRVGLEGYETRFPTELSGGEQQRVAIARAIVKKPRIILADEPTGNLDTNTAKQIVELLKELSKDCLILIVSHNVNDANNYADRIIELKKGRVISDKSRNPEFLDEVTLGGDKLIYPDGLALSDEDILFINKNKGADLVKKNDKFLPTEPLKIEEKRIKITSKSLSLGRELNLSGKFLKSKALAISFSAFMVAVIMVIMALAQTIIAFNGGEIVAGEMEKSNQSSLLLNKVVEEETQERLDGNYRVKVGDGDIQAFYDAGYEGKIYPILNYCVPISTKTKYYGIEASTFHKGVYMATSLGTMMVDDDFLQRKFGDYEYAARVDTFLDWGVIIPDYIADSLIAVNSGYIGKDYEYILGELGHSMSRFYINGIIKTDYKEKYGDLFNKIASGQIDLSKIYDNEEAKAFFNDVYDRLGYCYTTCPNFIESLLLTPALMHPGHYKLVFGGIEYSRGHTEPYITGYDHNSDVSKAPNNFGNGWMYSTSIPTIPEGAKYIRVAFNSGCDKAFGLTDPISTRDFALLRFSNSTAASKEQLSAVSKEDCGAFINAYDGTIEYNIRGAAGYSVVSDYIEIPEGAKITEFASITLLNTAYCAFYDENKVYISSEMAWSGVDLPENSIRMNYVKYNELFGTNYSETNLDEFIPHKITLSHHEYDDINNQNPLFSKEVTIIGLHASDALMFTSPEILELFQKDFVRTQGLYLDGTDGIGAALDAAEKLNFEPQSFAVESIHTMTKAVDVFIPIFELIAIFLCVGVIFILVNFSSKMINDKMHEIGILKALGTKNSSIGAIFGLQVALIAILTCILATAGYYFFIDLANDVLIESLMRLAPGHVVLDLDFLTFKLPIAIKNCILVIILAAISLVAPFIKIRFIESVKIIKSRE